MNDNAQTFPRYRITFSVAGRARFLSHLETVDTVLSALRRAGVRLALSRGMKPKPVIQLALPRPLGVESWSEICECELSEKIDIDTLSLEFAAQLPAGFELLDVTAVADGQRPAARSVAGAMYRIEFAMDPSPGRFPVEWVEEFLNRDEILVERRTPKQHRTLNVREFVTSISSVDLDHSSHENPTVRYHARLTEAGSVKPDEVVRALAQVAGCELTAKRIVRESVFVGEGRSQQQSVDPVLVGADVPEGPAKPWGSC